LDAVFDESKAH